MRRVRILVALGRAGHSPRNRRTHSALEAVADEVEQIVANCRREALFHVQQQHNIA